MRKILKLVLAVVLGSILILALTALYVHLRGIPTYATREFDLNVEATPERIQEGSRIVLTQCFHCHYSQVTNTLSGDFSPMDDMIGDLSTPNITRDTLYGIGSWTDGDLAFFLRTGIRPDGSFVLFMPKFIKLSDEDLFSVIAFMKSDDPLVAATSAETPRSRQTFINKLIGNFLMKPFEYPDEPVPEPDIKDTIQFGKYLATAKFECFYCHSAGSIYKSRLEPEKSPGFFAGGDTYHDRDGKLVTASNITMDGLTGIGSWSEEDFLKAVKYGIKPDGSPISWPMIPFTQLTDYEVMAIHQYLKTVPRIENDL